jgi:hypothetical protein
MQSLVAATVALKLENIRLTKQHASMLQYCKEQAHADAVLQASDNRIIDLEAAAAVLKL